MPPKPPPGSPSAQPKALADADWTVPPELDRRPLDGAIRVLTGGTWSKARSLIETGKIRVTGEIAPGDGGMLNQQLVQIPLEADATNIPQGIDVDVTGMEVGQAVHASDLKLPPGVTLQVDPETLVLAVIARTAEEPAEEAAEAPEVPEAVADQAAAGDGEQSG